MGDPYLDAMKLTHPLPIGAGLISIYGEEDQDDHGAIRRTGPNALGEILRAELHHHQYWIYDVHFSASGVSVLVDEFDLLEGGYHVDLIKVARPTTSL